MLKAPYLAGQIHLPEAPEQDVLVLQRQRQQKEASDQSMSHLPSPQPARLEYSAPELQRLSRARR